MFGCFRIEEIRDKDNETGLKEGEGTEMSTTVLFHIRDARSLRFEILTYGQSCLILLPFHLHPMTY